MRAPYHLNSTSRSRTEKTVPVRRVSFWKKIPRKEEEKATSKKSLVGPLPEGHPVDRDRFFCLTEIFCSKQVGSGAAE